MAEPATKALPERGGSLPTALPRGQQRRQRGGERWLQLTVTAGENKTYTEVSVGLNAFH